MRIVVTGNDFWRIIGVVFVVAGYFIKNEKAVELTLGEASLKGEAVAVLGLALIFVPIFLRGGRAK